MQLKQIKQGKYYATNTGAIGLCMRSGGTYPPSVMLDIVYPFPAGTRNFKPREITSEAVNPRMDKPNWPQQKS
jgi:hypothetical protein